MINNYKGTAAVTKMLAFNAVQTISSGASVSIGYSDTTPVDVGAEVSAEFEAIGASVNASITNATTIDSSSASGTKATNTVTHSESNTYTVQPGFQIRVTMVYDKQTIDLPYTLPITATGQGYFQDKWENSWREDVGSNITSSIQYGVPNSSCLDSSSDIERTMNSTGNIINTNASNFATKVTYSARNIAPVAPVAPIDLLSNRKLKSSGNLSPISNLPTVLKNGKEVSVGVHYDLAKTKKAKGARILGSVGDDIFHMGAKGQKVHTFGGNDIVYGSKFPDVITSRGDDKISSGKGADIITSTKGSTDIDAGEGNDKVNITSKGGGFDDVTLGKGKDKVNINLTKGDDYSFVIRDLGKK